MQEIRTVKEQIPNHLSRQGTFTLYYSLQKAWCVLYQLSYLPHLAPCEFVLLPKLNRGLKEKRFYTIGYMKEKFLIDLRAISTIELEKCFEEKKWRHKCIAFGRDYLERGKLD